MLFGPLGLQSQLIGHFEGLAQGQYNLIGQVLHRKGAEQVELINILDFDSHSFVLCQENNTEFLVRQQKKSIREKFLNSLKLLQKQPCVTWRGGSNLSGVLFPSVPELDSSAVA